MPHLTPTNSTRSASTRRQTDRPTTLSAWTVRSSGSSKPSVEALFKLADAIEKRVAAATARANKLTQAILAKAFRGELVPTEAELARQEGRDYEPASVLLARIRAERAAGHGQSQVKGRKRKARALRDS